MDLIFETGPMSPEKRALFVQWFERTIGTEIDIDHDNNILCFELTRRELEKCREKLKEVLA